MKKLSVNLLAFVILCAALVPQTATSQNPASTPSNPGSQASAIAPHEAHESSFVVAEGSIFHVALAQNLDAKKNKIEDEVATTILEDLRSNGEVLIPKDSKVVGHITQIQARSKEHPESQIAIAFDRLVIKDGAEMPISALIQAVAAPETGPADEHGQSGTGYGEVGGSTGGTIAGRSSPSSESGRGASGRVAGRPDGAANSGNSADQAAGRRGLSPTSQGVIGLKGLSLSAKGQAPQGSVISSDHHNVHLEHGTQFVLRVNAK